MAKSFKLLGDKEAVELTDEEVSCDGLKVTLGAVQEATGKTGSRFALDASNGVLYTVGPKDRLTLQPYQLDRLLSLQEESRDAVEAVVETPSESDAEDAETETVDVTDESVPEEATA